MLSKADANMRVNKLVRDLDNLKIQERRVIIKSLRRGMRSLWNQGHQYRPDAVMSVPMHEIKTAPIQNDPASLTGILIMWPNKEPKGQKRQLL